MWGHWNIKVPFLISKINLKRSKDIKNNSKLPGWREVSRWVIETGWWSLFQRTNVEKQIHPIFSMTNSQFENWEVSVTNSVYSRSYLLHKYCLNPNYMSRWIAFKLLKNKLFISIGNDSLSEIGVPCSDNRTIYR